MSWRTRTKYLIIIASICALCSGQLQHYPPQGPVRDDRGGGGGVPGIVGDWVIVDTADSKLLDTLEKVTASQPKWMKAFGEEEKKYIESVHPKSSTERLAIEVNYRATTLLSIADAIAKQQKSNSTLK